VTRSLVGREVDPAHIVVYLSGSMRALYDQSIDLVARQLAAACNTIPGAGSFAVSGESGAFRIGMDHDVNVRTVAHLTDPAQDIVILEVDHRAVTMLCLDEMPILRQVLAVALYCVRMVPKVLCLIVSPTPQHHAALTLSRRVFLLINLIVGFFGAIAVLLGAYQILSFALPQAWSAWADRQVSASYLLGFVLFSALFLRAGDIPKLLDSGQEYYGISDYLRAGRNAALLMARLNDVLDFAERNYVGATKHVVAFSYGSVLAYDFLFPKPPSARMPRARLASVTFMGFPRVFIDRLWPGYFAARSFPSGETFRWLNIRLPDDVLGSKITDYAELFGAAGQRVAAPPEPRDEEVEPQRPAAGEWNFVTRHLSYWDPAELRPAPAWCRVAANVLARS